MIEQLPTQFGPYRIERLLGAGGYGSVYLAVDTRLDRRVALKIPHFTEADGPRAFQRFEREAKAAAALDHPNLCTVHEFGRIDGRPYIAMAFIDGRPLTDYLGGQPLPVRKVALLVRKVALGLAAAHERGVIHRDLKPANIMVKKDGAPVVTDFGLARRENIADKRITRVGGTVGTPQYMAPEQIRAEDHRIGPATDVWALGVILYECLTGRPPFDAPGMAVAGEIVFKAPPPPARLRPEIGPALEAVCLKALAKEPADRFAGMANFARALADAARRGLPTGEPDLTPGERTNVFADLTPASSTLLTPPSTLVTQRQIGKPVWRRPPIIAAAIATILVLAGLGLWLAGGSKSPKPNVPTATTNRPSAKAVPTKAVPVNTIVKTYTWERGQPPVRIMPAARGFCALSAVTGRFAGNSESVTLGIEKDGWWTLRVQTQQPLKVTAVSFEQGIADTVRLSPKDYRWKAGDLPVRIAGRDDGFCVLTSVAGKLQATDDTGIILYPDGWHVSGHSLGGLSARAVHVTPKSPATSRLREREYSWAAQQFPVKMIPAAAGICFLAGIGGNFQGYGDAVKVAVEPDGYWYLSGQAAQPSVNARAISVELESMP